jgi:hypothetical protein
MTDDEYKQLYNAMSFKGEETKQLKEMIDSWHAIVDSAKEAEMTKEYFLKKLREHLQYYANKLQSGRFKGKQ